MFAYLTDYHCAGQSQTLVAMCNVCIPHRLSLHRRITNTCSDVQCLLTSQTIIPKEKTSTFSSYVQPVIISGAIQYGFPTIVLHLWRRNSLRLVDVRCDEFASTIDPRLLTKTDRARPKSATTTVSSWPQNISSLTSKQSTQKKLFDVHVIYSDKTLWRPRNLLR